ncbi:MAG: serine hydroxymethyltransferase [Rickettsiales bacterium]
MQDLTKVITDSKIYKSLTENLTKYEDEDIFNLIEQEKIRQEMQIMLIASENYTSQAVLKAQGSILTNKYAEGYPSKRWYEGCKIVDKIESLAIERLKKIFNVNYANVQPHSGSQSNQAVFAALLNPGDKILSMSMKSGGHLTHGANVSISGKWFLVENYEVNQNGELDYEQILEHAKKFKPKLIICGYSAYTRVINFKKFREISNEVGALLLADIAHIAGIIAAHNYENLNQDGSFKEKDNSIIDFQMSPVPYADVITSTTHKTLRGPRGGIIMTNNEEIAKKIDFAVFPGIQGGPLMHVIAAKAVAFHENTQKSYKEYIAKVLSNAKFLGEQLKNHGFNLVSNGTSNHMLLINLQNKNISGKDLAYALSKIGIICNKNNIPNDLRSPFITSGIRIGTAATTTRGFSYNEYSKIAEIITTTVDYLNNNINNIDEKISTLQKKYQDDIYEICSNNTIYK